MILASITVTIKYTTSDAISPQENGALVRDYKL